MAPPSADSKSTVSRSGITESKDGQRHIPSSVRADGSVRKEIRIRDGYKPPEDIDVYKNRTAEAWKNKGKGGVPGAEAVGEETLSSAASTKNAKRREARRKAAAAAPTVGSTDVVSKAEADTPQEPVDPEVEKAKEARKLSKKLRQARELKDKKDKGDSLLPEQFEKVIKINELIRQLDKLGFDADGEKKPLPE